MSDKIKPPKTRAPRNRTLELSDAEFDFYRRKLLRLNGKKSLESIVETIVNRTVCADVLDVLPLLPAASFDLLFADPPYNLTKNYDDSVFRRIPDADYEVWLDSWLAQTARLLKPAASVYICGDWRTSSAIERVGARYFKVQNRITWEREKGRGSLRNWKNNHEDIWFFTVSDCFTFNAAAVKTKRRVVAPYRENGAPKDWETSDDGNFRMTAPSNLWTDLSVPFWSMPENTEHPTQKPEKLLAKIILASSNENDLMLDLFAGSGTASVAAKKLNRNFVGVEKNEKYCCLAEKRLALAIENKQIQGLSEGVFWERNALNRKK